jgi:L-glyceraldehyde 3-phosphate reductase
MERKMQIAPYRADGGRYDTMQYRRVGKSGLKMSAVSLGLWQNFGGYDSYENCRAIVRRAFDLGITVFDLANNYGPPIGSAEETFGRLMKEDMRPYRDEMVVTTKAGYTMWPGPYGDWGSRKYMLSSLDRSLQRMGLDYVDIFYHHRMDPETPLEETMGALASAVHSGKALYAGISNYSPEEAAKAAKILDSMGVHCLICQSRYNLLDRGVERDGLFRTAEACGFGMTAFSPACAGPTDRKIQPRHPGGLPRVGKVPLPEPGLHHAGTGGESYPAGRGRAETRPDHDAACPELGAAGKNHGERARRGKPSGAARRGCEMPRKSRFHRRRASGNRFHRGLSPIDA